MRLRSPRSFHQGPTLLFRCEAEATTERSTFEDFVNIILRVDVVVEDQKNYSYKSRYRPSLKSHLGPSSFLYGADKQKLATPAWSSPRRDDSSIRTLPWCLIGCVAVVKHLTRSLRDLCILLPAGEDQFLWRGWGTLGKVPSFWGKITRVWDRWINTIHMQAQ